MEGVWGIGDVIEIDGEILMKREEVRMNMRELVLVEEEVGSGNESMEFGDVSGLRIVERYYWVLDGVGMEISG